VSDFTALIGGAEPPPYKIIFSVLPVAFVALAIDYPFDFAQDRFMIVY
jgi:hypothetical protein